MTKVKKTIFITEIISIVVLFLVIGTIINMNYNDIRGSALTENDIKSQAPSNCPSDFNFKKIDNNRITLLFKSDSNDIHIIDSLYKENNNGIYSFDEGRVLQPIKNNDYMEYTLSNINYRKVSIYSGGSLCKEYYILKDDITLNDMYHEYDFSKYIIITEDGLVHGINSNIKSNSSAFIIGKISIKNAYDESGARITFEENDKVAHINFNIPKEYVSTYLLHPLNMDDKFDDKSLSKSNNTLNNEGDYVAGLEIYAKEGTNVYAMDTGEVVDVVLTPNNKGTYGCRIIIKSTYNNKNYYFTYAHLKKGSILVKKGDLVLKGDVIAKVGKTSSINKNLNKSLLYVGMTYEYNNEYYPILLSNFINKKESYSNIDINNYKDYQKLKK